MGVKLAQVVRHRSVRERLPQFVAGGSWLQTRVDAAFWARLQHDPGFGLPALARRQKVRLAIRGMHLDREHLARVEKLQKQGEPAETAGEPSQHLLRRLLQQLPNGLSFEQPVGDPAGVVIAVTEDPGFADRAVARQRRGKQIGELPTAPGSILVDRLETQRVQRHFTHDKSRFCPSHGS